MRLSCTRTLGHGRPSNQQRSLPGAPASRRAGAGAATGCDWAFEPKWDGFRCIAARSADWVSLVTFLSWRVATSGAAIGHGTLCWKPCSADTSHSATPGRSCWVATTSAATSASPAAYCAESGAATGR
jgi:hypothetical protein